MTAVVENNGDELLPDSDQQALKEVFARVEARKIGEGVHERYHQLAHELAGVQG